MKQYKNYWTTNNHLSKSLLTNTAVVNPELLKDFSDAEKWLDEKEAAGFRVGLIGVMGSRAFGNPRPDSDYDLRGFYVISPRNWMGSLHQSAPQTLTFKQGNVDIELQELSTFTRLLRRGNQNNMLLISSLCNNSVSFGSVCRLNKRIFPTKGAITNFFTLACKVKPLNKKIQGKDLLSLEGQLKSDLIDILRRERTDEQAKKTCKNIVKLLYVLNISKTQGFNKSLNGTNVKIFHESWNKLQHDVIKNYRDSKQLSLETLKLYSILGYSLGCQANDVLNATRNEYSESKKQQDIDYSEAEVNFNLLTRTWVYRDCDWTKQSQEAKTRKFKNLLNQYDK